MGLYALGPCTNLATSSSYVLIGWSTKVLKEGRYEDILSKDATEILRYIRPTIAIRNMALRSRDTQFGPETSGTTSTSLIEQIEL